MSEDSKENQLTLREMISKVSPLLNSTELEWGIDDERRLYLSRKRCVVTQPIREEEELYRVVDAAVMSFNFDILQNTQDLTKIKHKLRDMSRMVDNVVVTENAKDIIIDIDSMIARMESKMIKPESG